MWEFYLELEKFLGVFFLELEKFLGIFPRIPRNFSENLSEFFREYVGNFPRICRKIS
jgi:hypothetical protein